MGRELLSKGLNVSMEMRQRRALLPRGPLNKKTQIAFQMHQPSASFTSHSSGLCVAARMSSHPNQHSPAPLAFSLRRGCAEGCFVSYRMQKWGRWRVWHEWETKEHKVMTDPKPSQAGIRRFSPRQETQAPSEAHFSRYIIQQAAGAWGDDWCLTEAGAWTGTSEALLSCRTLLFRRLLREMFHFQLFRQRWPLACPLNTPVKVEVTGESSAELAGPTGTLLR